MQRRLTTMAIIKGNWYGPDGKPFTNDGQMQIGEKQGQRCKIRAHLTKRLRHPELFPQMQVFGNVMRTWKNEVDAASKLAWNNSQGWPENRAGKPFTKLGHLHFCNCLGAVGLDGNEPLFNINYNVLINVSNFAILFYEPESRRVRFGIDFYRYQDQPYKFAVIVHQVQPLWIGVAARTKYMRKISIRWLETDRIWPETDSLAWWERCEWLPDRNGILEFVVRFMWAWCDPWDVVPHISHMTLTPPPGFWQFDTS